MQAEQDTFLEKLYRENFEHLWRYASAYLGDPERAAEIVQDTFHEAVEQIDVLMRHDNPQGWLKTVLKNKLMHARRSLNRYIHRFLSLDTDVINEDSVLSTQSPPYKASDILKEIRAALSPEEWDLLRAITLEGRTYKAVSKELGATVWTCQKRIQRIREKLRRQFPTDFWI